MILKLSDVLETQNQGIRQNPYKYKIVPIRECYDQSNRDIYHIYLDINDIPEIYMERQVYDISPDLDSNGCMYLKIVIL